MKALVLAAGKSTRIASVTGGRPKPLIEIDGKPVIARTLEWLGGAGIRDIWINLHHRPDDIRSALGDGSRFGVNIHYAHEREILGTAGAFRALAREWDATTLVVYGDNLMRFDLAAFQARHRLAGLPATVALFDPARHVHSGIAGGRVVVHGDGRVREFLEGAPPAASGGGLVNAGAYLLEPAVAGAIAPGVSDFARDVFPAMVGRGELAGHVLEDAGYCVGLDTPESFSVGERLVSSRQVALA